MRRLDNHIQPFLSSSSSSAPFSTLTCRGFPSLGSAWSPVGAARLFVSFFILSLAAHPLALVLPPAGRPAAAALLPRAGGSTTRRAVSSGKLSFGAQIGCIVGAYVGALLIVGLLILKFSRTRRRTLRGGLQGVPQEPQEQRHRPRWRRASDLKASFPARPPAAAFTLGRKPHPQSPTHVRNFSYPSPNTPPGDPYQQPAAGQKNTNSGNSTARTRVPAGQEVDQITSIPWGPSVCLTPVADPLAEQREVMSSRREASDQLADLYRLVLEQDDERAGQPRQGPQQKQQSPTESTGSGRDAAALAALAAPPRPPSLPPPPQPMSSEKQPGRGLLRRGKSKPADLSLDKDKGAMPTSTPTSASEKRKSRGGALLSLLSPKRRTKVLSISSPLMTPKSAAAAGHPAEQEMHPLTPRHYVPMPPPPVPGGGAGAATPLTPDQSPVGSPRDDTASSIDGRLSAPPTLPQLASRHSKASLLQRTPTQEAEEKEEGGGVGPTAQGRAGQDEPHSEPQSIEARLGLADATLSSPATTPVGGGDASQPLLGSASSQASSPTTSVRAQSPPVGLPQSPRSGTRFSGLPQSPKPGSTFQPTLAAVAPTPEQQQPHKQQNSLGSSQSAVRPGGTLALRAYEPSGAEVTSSSSHFKQTVFERMLSPATSPGSGGGDSGGGGPPRTGGPFTPGPVPYTPYQPKTPLFPMSPTLVTKEDRKRMKKLEPKTPVTEMVKSTDEIW